MDKLKKNGLVAVVYSPGYGAGWSTEHPEKAAELCMDKEITQAVLVGDKDKVKTRVQSLVGKGHLSTTSLEVCWVPEGSVFEITEHDGYERLTILSETYMCA